MPYNNKFSGVFVNIIDVKIYIYSVSVFKFRLNNNPIQSNIYSYIHYTWTGN